MIHQQDFPTSNLRVMHHRDDAGVYSLEFLKIKFVPLAQDTKSYEPTDVQLSDMEFKRIYRAINKNKREVRKANIKTADVFDLLNDRFKAVVSPDKTLDDLSQYNIIITKKDHKEFTTPDCYIFINPKFKISNPLIAHHEESNQESCQKDCKESSQI